MTLATKITVFRIFMVPVFATLAIAYSLRLNWTENPETLRWAALIVFTTAAISDGVDGWIARHFNQHSDLGAFLDPIADKGLVLSAVVVLTIFKWDTDGWSIPYWFAAIVFLRDSLILLGVHFLRRKRLKVVIHPHWTGKACTFSLFVVFGWVMLKIIPISPIYPCIVAAILILLSTIEYLRQALAILRQSK